MLLASLQGMLGAAATGSNNCQAEAGPTRASGSAQQHARFTGTAPSRESSATRRSDQEVCLLRGKLVAAHRRETMWHAERDQLLDMLQAAVRPSICTHRGLLCASTPYHVQWLLKCQTFDIAGCRQHREAEH